MYTYTIAIYNTHYIYHLYSYMNMYISMYECMYLPYNSDNNVNVFNNHVCRTSHRHTVKHEYVLIYIAASYVYITSLYIQ